MTEPAERVISGQSELCVTKHRFFVRDADGAEPDEYITPWKASGIIGHPDVDLLRQNGVIKQYGVRAASNWET